MKISAKEAYACSAVLELALNFDADVPVRVQDIAQRQRIPMKFLFQIMQILKGSDIVRSKRGTEGGYALARHPGQLTVGDVIQSVSGPFVQVSELGESAHHFKSIWADVDSAITTVLTSVNFEDLARRARADQKQVMYYI